MQGRTAHPTSMQTRIHARERSPTRRVALPHCNPHASTVPKLHSLLFDVAMVYSLTPLLVSSILVSHFERSPDQLPLPPLPLPPPPLLPGRLRSFAASAGLIALLSRFSHCSLLPAYRCVKSARQRGQYLVLAGRRVLARAYRTGRSRGRFSRDNMACLRAFSLALSRSAADV